jgi:hypothetical protein
MPPLFIHSGNQAVDSYHSLTYNLDFRCYVARLKIIRIDSKIVRSSSEENSVLGTKEQTVDMYWFTVKWRNRPLD